MSAPAKAKAPAFRVYDPPHGSWDNKTGNAVYYGPRGGKLLPYSQRWYDAAMHWNELTEKQRKKLRVTVEVSV